MHDFDYYYPSQRLSLYYIRELVSILVFLVMKWAHSSPGRSSNSTCSVAVVIYGWECTEIKLQLTTDEQTIWRSRYVNGKTI